MKIALFDHPIHIKGDDYAYDTCVKQDDTDWDTIQTALTNAFDVRATKESAGMFNLTLYAEVEAGGTETITWRRKIYTRRRH